MTTAIHSAKPLPYKLLAQALRNYAQDMTCLAILHWRAESFRATENLPMTMRRAMALNAVLEKCLLPVFPGELLIGVGNVGQRLPDNSISPETLKAAKEYLETIGARNFTSHSSHHAPDYAALTKLGFGGLKEKVRASMPEQDETGRIFLESMLVALDGASSHMLRWSKHLTEIIPDHPEHAELLKTQANRMERLAEEAPAGFADALQLVLMYHYMMQLDLRGAMAFGRLDQYLYPFYQADLAAGRITDNEVQDLFDHFFAKITVDEDVQNIALGGVRPEDASDATNALSYMILEACKRIGQPGGNCTARIHKNTPMEFLKKCAEVIRTGVGYPSVFNDDVEIPALLRQGYDLADARDYCFVGCIEVFMQGKQAPWADSRLNPAWCLNLAIFNGIDSMTGKQEGLRTGDEFPDFEAFHNAFIEQCHHHLNRKIRELNEHQLKYDSRAMDFTSPLMSALVDACIDRGRDLNDGGAIYPGNFGFGVMGIASLADSLAALKKYVFDEPRFSFDKIKTMLKANFVGFEKERQLLLRGAPKYGNDDDYVDQIAVRFVHDFAKLFDDYRTPGGGHYWALMAANVQNVSGGAQVAATPDGRFAGTPLSDAASPSFGRDLLGPTATIRSVSKIPYNLCVGGNVVNMKLNPNSLEGDSGISSLAALIRTCFDLGGSELQFNTTDRKVLEDAIKNPETHAGLVVRVSGFSARFITLHQDVQKDILARTEHSIQ